MMHLLRKYDVAPFGRNDAMFAIMCRQAHIIRRSRHHWRSQHHLAIKFAKRTLANIIQKSLICLVDKLGFFGGRGARIFAFGEYLFPRPW